MSKISIQFSRFSAFYSPLIGTMAGGFLKDEGLDHEWSNAPVGRSAVDALVDGSAHVVQSAPSQGFGSAWWAPLQASGNLLPIIGEATSEAHLAMLRAAAADAQHVGRGGVFVIDDASHVAPPTVDRFRALSPLVVSADGLVRSNIYVCGHDGRSLRLRRGSVVRSGACGFAAPPLRDARGFVVVDDEPGLFGAFPLRVPLRHHRNRARPEHGSVEVPMVRARVARRAVKLGDADVDEDAAAFAIDAVRVRLEILPSVRAPRPHRVRARLRARAQRRAV